MLKQIISGAQIGADRGGLIAAKALNLQTGGWMPKGFKAKDGYHPEFATIYNIKEHQSPLYPPRTFANVAESDGTVRFAVDFKSAGEECTLKAIVAKKKPYFDVYVLGQKTPEMLAEWITQNDIEILNIAGNAIPALEEFVIAFLTETMKILTTGTTGATPGWG